MSPRSLLALAVLLVIALAAVSVVGNPTTRAITIETERIPELYPHGHDPGDSVLDPDHHKLLTSDVVVLDRDVWVAGISGEIINAPSVVLHHGELLRVDKIGTDTECETAYGGGEILSFGQDQSHTPEFWFPEGHALFIPKGAPLVLVAMLHNPLPPVGPGGEYHDVSARLILHEAGAVAGSSFKPVSFRLLHLDDVPCQTDDMGFVFTVPPKTEEYEFRGALDAPHNPASYTFDRPATILYLGAHLHGWEGGRELLVYKNDGLLETFPTRRALDDPYRFDTPHYQTNIHMEAGDTLSIGAVYDNSYDVPIVGAMGMLGVFYTEK